MNAGNPLDVQVGGSHYKDCNIQPVEFIEANHLQFLEGNVVKRVVRHNRSGGKGKQDLEKAIHELQLLIALRYTDVGNVAQGGFIRVTVDTGGDLGL